MKTEYYIKLEIDNIEIEISAEDMGIIKQMKTASNKWGTLYDSAVCFNYALNDKKQEFEYCEDAHAHIIKNYNNISLNKIVKGDIVMYHERGYEIIEEEGVNHFGIIIKTDNTLEGTYIKSKWGTGYVYKSDLFYVPTIYGDKVTFWSKK